EAGDLVEIELTDLVTGVDLPVFFAGAVDVTGGECAARPGEAWDTLVIAVPRDGEGTCTIEYAPSDRATSATSARPGVITVEVVAAAADEPAGDDGAGPGPTASASAEGADADAVGPKPATEQSPSVADDEVLSVTVTLRRDEAPLAGGVTAALVVVALIAGRVRRRRRDRQLLAAAIPTAPAESTPAPIPDPEERAW
ncbi:MAG TPA: hypothetical protein VGC37_18680, partial [Friedmanniella sp.]